MMPPVPRCRLKPCPHWQAGGLFTRATQSPRSAQFHVDSSSITFSAGRLTLANFSGFHPHITVPLSAYEMWKSGSEPSTGWSLFGLEGHEWICLFLTYGLISVCQLIFGAAELPGAR